MRRHRPTVSPAVASHDPHPGRWRLALAGFREPIVAILLLTAVFTAISGRLVDGVLLLIAGVGLAWDAARSRYRVSAPSGAAGVAGTGPAGQVAGQPPVGPATARRRRPLIILAGIVGCALYSAVVGMFTRYSWPASVAVTGLAAAVVAIGWRGPLRPRTDPGKLPARGAALWAGLLVAGGLWELAALFLQPSLTTTSNAHPTISALTDPLLTSHTGRSAALAIWVAIGWFLAER